MFFCSIVVGILLYFFNVLTCQCVRLIGISKVKYSVFNEDTYCTGWMMDVLLLFFSCPFVVDFCPYNYWQKSIFLIDEINKVFLFCLLLNLINLPLLDDTSVIE